METYFLAKFSYHRRQSPLWIVCAIFLLSLSYSSLSFAFDKLTDAQALVYDTAHLSNTNSGQTITYQYKGESDESDPVADKVILSITEAHENDKRDVQVTFLSEDRNLPLPDFEGYRGNPVIIAMLEYVSRAMGSETGGGALYFRNRIRDALADKALKIHDKKVKVSGTDMSVLELQFSPFKDDAYLGSQPRYADSVFTIALSDEVPGGVVSINVESSFQDELQFFHGIEISEI